jgi:hypothetical protein
MINVINIITDIFLSISRTNKNFNLGIALLILSVWGMAMQPVTIFAHEGEVHFIEPAPRLYSDGTAVITSQPVNLIALKSSLLRVFGIIINLYS